MFNGMTQTAGDLSLIFTSWISWNQLMGCSSVTHSYSAWVHLCNKCWTSHPAAKKRLFRGGQDVLWQRGIRASIQKGWKEESHKREIPRSSDRITKKSLYPRVLVIFNRSFTPNLIIIANIFNWTSYWRWICLHNTIAILIIFKGLDDSGILVISAEYEQSSRFSMIQHCLKRCSFHATTFWNNCWRKN